jgi:hypothetical protein
MGATRLFAGSGAVSQRTATDPTAPHVLKRNIQTEPPMRIQQTPHPYGPPGARGVAAMSSEGGFASSGALGCAA